MEWKEAKKIINKDPEVLKELRNLEPEYQIIRQLISLRIEKKITQKELVGLIGDYNEKSQLGRGRKRITGRS